MRSLVKYIAIFISALIIFSCKKDKNDDSSGSVTDIDGNTYKTVTIGTQVWMAANLKTTRFNDGATIPLISDNNTWANLNESALCWYDNDESNKDKYGALYNWYAVDNKKVCPTGWHIPSDDDWETLKEFIAGELNTASVVGAVLKSKDGWNEGLPGTDKYGFKALPGGFRASANGSYGDVLNTGYWWSSTSQGTDDAWGRYIQNVGDHIYSFSYNHKTGASIRCVQDN